MKKPTTNNAVRGLAIIGASALICATGLFGSASAVRADDTYDLAPPVSAPPDTDDDAAVSTTFNWQEVPSHQKVTISKAVFDQGGYQLYDNVGETILVPFKNDNLYVMKFAKSPDDTMYFVNSGTTPVLYVPDGGYLENATVDGGRWYPFTTDFAPTTPVYLGIAPSWDDYCDIGWYPDMYCYGGYWCGTSVGVFTPCFGLFISFGGHHFDGWGGYRDFEGRYPAPYHVGFFRDGIYGYGAHSYWGDRSFHGGYGRGYDGGFHGGYHVGENSFGQHFRGGSGSYGGGYHSSNFSSGAHSGYGGGYRGGSFDGRAHNSSYGGGTHESNFGGSGGFRGGTFGGGSHSSNFGGSHSGDSGGGSHGGGFGGGSHDGGFGGGFGGGRH